MERRPREEIERMPNPDGESRAATGSVRADSGTLSLPAEWVRTAWPVFRVMATNAG